MEILFWVLGYVGFCWLHNKMIGSEWMKNLVYAYFERINNPFIDVQFFIATIIRL